MITVFDNQLPESTPTTPAPLPTHAFEVFYDGDCPLCLREINLLRRMDKQDRILFTNIVDHDFNAADYGKQIGKLMAEIHGRLPDGTWVVGVEVFRHLYSLVGFGWAVSVTRWPVVRQSMDWGYRFFAKYRLSLTGRRCEVERCNT